MLKVIFGEEIEKEEFILGYTFKSKVKFLDDIIIYKHNTSGYTRETKKSPVTTDCRSIENHYDCELLIYTDLDKEIEMKYALCMGKSGNPARLHLPIEEVELIDREGLGFNQYTPISIGTGVIKPITLLTKFNSKLNSYDAQVEHLRFNKEFEYNKNYDAELEHNIVLWKYKDGEVSFFD